MTFKLRHVTVLFFALFLGAAAMYIDIVPWLRVLVAAFLLLPIIYAADGLGIAPMLNVVPDRTVRPRRFGVLRSEVMQLLDVVRRLNWLTVDLERGVRNNDDVKEDIAAAERRLEIRPLYDLEPRERWKQRLRSVERLTIAAGLVVTPAPEVPFHEPARSPKLQARAPRGVGHQLAGAHHLAIRAHQLELQAQRSTPAGGAVAFCDRLDHAGCRRDNAVGRCRQRQKHGREQHGEPARHGAPASRLPPA